MRFCPLTETGPQDGRAALSSEYAAAKEIGRVRLGELRLYFRSGLRVYYIPYRDVRRVFRRVQLIPAKAWKRQGELRVENLVVCGEAGELAQIQLPGADAARQLMDELCGRIPEAAFGKPAPEGPSA